MSTTTRNALVTADQVNAIAKHLHMHRDTYKKMTAAEAHADVVNAVSTTASYSTFDRIAKEIKMKFAAKAGPVNLGLGRFMEEFGSEIPAE